MTTVKIDTQVPSPERPGCPHIVFFGNGDWEFCTAHDAEFIGDYMGSVAVVEILNLIALECLEDEEMDECDGESILIQDFNIDTSDPARETVLTLHYTGRIGVEVRSSIDRLIADCRSSVFNFISIPEFFSDLEYWIKHNRKRMTEIEEDYPQDLTDLME